MPRVRRKQIGRVGALPDERTLDFLATGHRVTDAPVERARLRQAWATFGDAITAMLVFAESIHEVAEHSLRLACSWRGLRAGSRCWGWWEWSAPEPRRRIGKGPKPDPQWGMAFGVPRAMIGDHMLRDDWPHYETQLAYLERLDLLLPGEAELITPDDEDTLPC